MALRPDDHLTDQEVQAILDYVRDWDAILVGGQSLNVWARFYEKADPALANLGPLTSKDVDFLENPAAQRKLRDALLDGKVAIPDPDDHTPNAAIVSGLMGDRLIEIDFMKRILGVKTEDIKKRFVAIAGQLAGKTTRMLLMHPHDCLLSRLANVNTLHRTSEHSLTQAEASVKILRLYLGQMIETGKLTAATTELVQLEYTIRDRHAGKPSHTQFGDRIDPLGVMRSFANHPKLDQRWNEKILLRAIDRSERILRKHAATGAEAVAANDPHGHDHEVIDVPTPVTRKPGEPT